MTESGPTGDGQQDWVYHVAAQLAAADLSELRPPKRSRGRKALIVAGAVAGVVALAVLGGVLLARKGGDGDSTAAPGGPGPGATSAAAPVATAPTTSSGAPTTSVTAAPATAAAETTVPETTVPETTAAAETTVPETTVPETTAAAETTVPVTTVPVEEAATSEADPGALPVRWAEYTNGGVILGGRVPDQATADEIAARVAAVVGAANVHVEYTLDPSAPRPDSAPLYVRDSILFASGKADLNPTARQTLDLGVLLLNLYPQVTFDISGHTDSVGTEESNLALSQRRIDVIVAYLESKGIDPSRLTAVAMGESDPIASNDTPEGRAANRRIEIQVNHFLG